MKRCSCVTFLFAITGLARLVTYYPRPRHVQNLSSIMCICKAYKSRLRCESSQPSPLYTSYPIPVSLMTCVIPLVSQLNSPFFTGFPVETRQTIYSFAAGVESLDGVLISKVDENICSSNAHRFDNIFTFLIWYRILELLSHLSLQSPRFLHWSIQSTSPSSHAKHLLESGCTLFTLDYCLAGVDLGLSDSESFGSEACSSRIS